jgi:hypothetical protein
MSGAATGPEFDPRYDARFQRGWGGGEPDGAAPDSPADLPDPPVEPVEEPHVEADTDAPAPDALGPPEASEPPESTGQPDPAPLPPRVAEAAEADAARIVRIALVTAWAISGAAALVGAGLVWSLVAATDPFGARPDGPEMVLQTLAQFAAPSLLATGLLGIVVLTIVDGLRRANRLVTPTPPNGSEP